MPDKIGKKHKKLDEEIAESKDLTVGQMLKGTREDLKLSLEEISAELHIEPRFLQALEEDNLEVFSAPVFTKGYLRQYGKRLGLRESDLLVQYYRQAKDNKFSMVPLASQSIMVGGYARSIEGWKLALGVLFLFVIIGFVIWSFYLSQKSDQVVISSVSGEVSRSAFAVDNLELLSVLETKSFDG
jgi:cytoskeleton protein RodZ